MPYTPPSGWVEQLRGIPQGRVNGRRFHVREDCPAIAQGSAVHTTDKPYSAARCWACAK
jgi:hypothetical protein